MYTFFSNFIPSTHLISERETMQTNVKPRGWDNDQELLKKGIMKRRPKNDDDEYDDDDEEFDMEDFEDFDEDDHDGLRDHRTVRLKGQEEDAAGDDDFDRFLEQEYDDGQLGYISDAEEEELQGVIDIEGNELFNQAIEEFIQEKKDSILATGVTVTKGARALKDDVPSAEVNVKKEADEQKLRQIEGQLVLEELAEQGVDTSIPTCQEYLREEQKRVSGKQTLLHCVCDVLSRETMHYTTYSICCAVLSLFHSATTPA
jgi:hypothetical protein